jgi:hypothetical protein
MNTLNLRLDAKRIALEVEIWKIQDTLPEYRTYLGSLKLNNSKKSRDIIDQYYGTYKEVISQYPEYQALQAYLASKEAGADCE